MVPRTQLTYDNEMDALKGNNKSENLMNMRQLVIKVLKFYGNAFVGLTQIY